MGMPADLDMITKDMIGAAMDMVKAVMPGALFHDLDRQKGMAGDDDAGHEFAKVYESAASTALDKMGFSALVMSETGRGLMHTAREFIARESHIASQILCLSPPIKAACPASCPRRMSLRTRASPARTPCPRPRVRRAC
ncbi:hypothetical protein ABZX93_14810 [Streptomyces sp. NPDC006632]|uniref:hypothetical protein n=1 Tax=Streptomyces sp. NPDC006632 TaxID=3157182 RepID=UPI0033A75E56